MAISPITPNTLIASLSFTLRQLQILSVFIFSIKAVSACEMRFFGAGGKKNFDECLENNAFFRNNNLNDSTMNQPRFIRN